MSNLPPVSDWMLERYLLKELSPEQMTAMAARLEHDVDLAARLRALETSNAEILAQYAPAGVAAAVLRKAHVAGVREREAKRRNGWRLFMGLAPALAAVVLAVTVFLPNSGPFSGVPEEVTRFKGLDPRVVLYRQSASGAETLAANATASEGDVLQVAYVAAGRKYGAVISIDGNGAVTVHMPAESGVAERLEPGGETPLPTAYELDAAPGFERFILVTADRPFEMQTVVAAARKLTVDPNQAKTAALALPAGLEQFSVLLRKR